MLTYVKNLIGLLPERNDCPGGESWPELHEEFVHQAAVWLDNTYPGWARRINTRTLNMSEGMSCVLAQASGLAFEAAKLRHLNDIDDAWFRYSFSYPRRGDWRGLRMAWNAEITARRAARLEDATT